MTGHGGKMLEHHHLQQSRSNGAVYICVSVCCSNVLRLKPQDHQEEAATNAEQA